MLKEVRSKFPFIQHLAAEGRVYFDSAATSQKPDVVLEAMHNFYCTSNVNVHRGSYQRAQLLADTIDSIRQSVLNFLGASSSFQTVFVKSATEGLNIVALGLARSLLKRGDTILTTEVEHHANLLPWYEAARVSGATVEVVPLSELTQNIRESVKIVAFTHCSNVLGVITPVAQICESARTVGAVTVIDGAQSVPHLPVDLQQVSCDFFTFSAHKLCGPTGVGCLVGKVDSLASLPPLLVGGNMVNEVCGAQTTWKNSPDKFEAGTLPLAEIIGLGAAIEFLSAIGMENIRSHEMRLTQQLIEGLKKIGGISIYGPSSVEERSGVVSFNLEGAHPHDVAFLLDQRGFYVRDGSSCAQPLMRALGIPGVVRASPYLYNTADEVNRFCSAIKEIREFFG